MSLAGVRLVPRAARTRVAAQPAARWALAWPLRPPTTTQRDDASVEVTGLLLEKGPSARAVLCPGNLSLADNIQIPVFKLGSGLQPRLCEGLERKCSRAGRSGGARAEIRGKDVQPAPRAGGFRPRAGAARAAASPRPCGRRSWSQAGAATAGRALGRGGIAQRKGRIIPRTNLRQK